MTSPGSGRPRIVITGLGVVSPVGIGLKQTWSSLVNGVSGVGPITRFDSTDFAVKLAAEATDFDPNDFMDAKQARRTGRFVQFSIAASRMAVESAKLDMSKEQAERVGVSIGTHGGIFHVGEFWQAMKERGPRRIDPFLALKIGHHMAPAQVGRMLGAKGPNSSVNSACASGADGISHASLYLRSGHADVMIAGGSEDMISPLAMGYFGLLGAMTKQASPEKASRPFDLNRSGFVLGEGAGILVLETEEHALRRGAPILAELGGVGATYDAYDDAAPDAEGQSLAMKSALRDAGMSPEQVQYVNAHGTSTELNDKVETQAIKLAFGKHAHELAVSSNKSMIGHLSAGAGAVESVATVMTIANGIIPPTINYETPDPDCDLDYVPNVARKANVEAAICNSFGLGGQNVCLLYKAYH
jgi:3-oxoacyl-[acyl-carrier-protein] synthase II